MYCAGAFSSQPFWAPRARALAMPVNSVLFGSFMFGCRWFFFDCSASHPPGARIPLSCSHSTQATASCGSVPLYDYPSERKPFRFCVSYNFSGFCPPSPTLFLPVASSVFSDCSCFVSTPNEPNSHRSGCIFMWKSLNDNRSRQNLIHADFGCTRCAAQPCPSLRSPRRPSHAALCARFALSPAHLTLGARRRCSRTLRTRPNQPSLQPIQFTGITLEHVSGSQRALLLYELKVDSIHITPQSIRFDCFANRIHTIRQTDEWEWKAFWFDCMEFALHAFLRFFRSALFYRYCCFAFSIYFFFCTEVVQLLFRGAMCVCACASLVSVRAKKFALFQLLRSVCARRADECLCCSMENHLGIPAHTHTHKTSSHIVLSSVQPEKYPYENRRKL